MEIPTPIHPATHSAIARTNQQALHASELRYRRLFEAAKDGILILNAVSAEIEDVNPYLIDLLGYTHQEFLGKKLWQVGPFADMAENKEMFAELQKTGYVRYDDLPLKTKQGASVAVEFVSNVYDCDGTKVIQCNIRNITQRHADRAKIHRHTQLYAALSQCSQAIVHCVSEDDLFLQICRIAVQLGGMAMACVSLVDRETRIVRPAASFGDDSNYLADIVLSSDADSPFGLGPTGTSIREDRVVWCQDFMNDPTTVPWRLRVNGAGFAASASLPLHRDGHVVGAFSVYSGAPNSFDELARELLVEMTSDISFGLDNFDREAKRRQTQAEVEFQKTILMTQQETSLDAILVVGEIGQVVSSNRQFGALWKLSPEFLAAGVDGTVLKAVADQTENPANFVAEVRLLTEHRRECGHDEVLLKDGRTIDRYSAPAIGADAKYYGRVWYFRDITERKDAQAKIVYLNRVYAVLSDINSLIVRVRHRDELFQESCRVAVEIGGFRMAMICILDEATGTIVPVASVGKDEALSASISKILSSGELAHTTMVARAIREKRPIVSNDSQHDPQVAFRAAYGQAGVGSMSVLPLVVADEAIGALALYTTEKNFFHAEELKLLTELAGDIAFAVDHIDKQDRLDYLAYYDVLTGLANRRLFLERVAQHMRSASSSGKRLALLLIDLERFKNINDSLGWPAGDSLLRQVGDWFKLNFGDASLLARLGADHFAAVLPDIRQDDDVAQVIEQMLDAFRDHPFHLTDSVFRVTAKVGAALFPDDGADADTVFRHAEAALKKAKTSGEKFLLYTPKMTEKVAAKLSLENQLRQALDNNEFVLHYQPKVNLVSGAIVSAEALIRWNDPRTGLVPPGQFIPILEETGLIYEVGRWALRQAIEDYLRWRAAGLAVVRLAVNVSPLQLRNRDFIAEIRRTLDIDAHAADGLELEITETLIMADVNHSISSLRAIRAMGVCIAIDDFGTGFSSLSYLAKLPVDTLKIDRSFIVDMTGSPEGLALVSTIINLAHSLKLKVVAEGVETEEQSRLLLLLNCDEMQGFLFSKPVPVDVFETRFLRPPVAA
ncbi:MAG: EAL domain-containing protein [Burkholderiaceae bacterium]